MVLTVVLIIAVYKVIDSTIYNLHKKYLKIVQRRMIIGSLILNQ